MKTEVWEERESRNIWVWEKPGCLSEGHNNSQEDAVGLEDWSSYWKEVESCTRIADLLITLIDF